MSDKILILTLPHGAAHQRLAHVLSTALFQNRPTASVKIVDALEYCTGWFRFYYNSYQFPLDYCPALWSWIENLQHAHESTGPRWMYRRGAQPLFRLLRSLAPSVVVATEVGLCEIAALFKRDTRTRFPLVAVPTGVDLDRAWVQPEVNLYAVEPSTSAQVLEGWGVSRRKILACGVPVDPLFGTLPHRITARQQLGLTSVEPLVLIFFGGTGIAARPHRLMRALRSLREPFQLVAMAGRNPQLRRQLEKFRKDQPNLRVMGWVDDVHVWMSAADLLIGKPGGSSVFEAINSGLPLIVHDPLPGSQRRTSAWIEQKHLGYWIHRPEEVPRVIASLWRDGEKLQEFRRNALALSRPGAAGAAAQAILDLLPTSPS